LPILLERSRNEASAESAFGYLRLSSIHHN
jgi:hypothetical protein